MPDTAPRYNRYAQGVYDDDDPSIPTLTQRIDAPPGSATLPAWLQTEIARLIDEAVQEASVQLRLRLAQDIPALVARALPGVTTR